MYPDSSRRMVDILDFNILSGTTPWIVTPKLKGPTSTRIHPNRLNIGVSSSPTPGRTKPQEKTAKGNLGVSLCTTTHPFQENSDFFND